MLRWPRLSSILVVIPFAKESSAVFLMAIRYLPSLFHSLQRRDAYSFDCRDGALRDTVPVVLCDAELVLGRHAKRGDCR